MGMGQIVDYSQFILQIEKAIANGVASLDSNAPLASMKLPFLNRPANAQHYFGTHIASA